MENVTETDEDGMETVEERRVPVIVHPIPPPLPLLPLPLPQLLLCTLRLEEERRRGRVYASGLQTCAVFARPRQPYLKRTMAGCLFNSLTAPKHHVRPPGQGGAGTCTCLLAGQ